MMPLISHLSTTKECFDALANLYEKKAPTQKRTLKKQLRTLKMGKDETISTFFCKIAQTRDQLTTIGVAVDDDELVQTAVDGLPESWETFLSSVNGREVQPNFERLCHDCLEEESRLKSINEPSTVKGHALLGKARKWKKFPQHKGKGKKPQGKHSHSHLTKIRCFNCNKLGHYAKDCRNPPSQQKRKGRFHASVATKEEEPQRKRTIAVTKEQEQRRESYLVSSLFRAVTKLEEIWLVDNEASKHMTGFKQNLMNYRDKKFNVKVELGGDGTYAIKRIGSKSFQLQSGNVFHIEEILYVPGLKKNLISVAVLESKGYTVAFSKGKALMWPSNESMGSTMIIGAQEGGLYKVTGQVIQALAHEIINPCELWHKRFGHLNYHALPGLQKMVTGMPVFSFEHNRICRGCALGKNTKKAYSHNNRKSNGILDLIHSDLCGPMKHDSLKTPHVSRIPCGDTDST
jgi:hypothetical protein